MPRNALRRGWAAAKFFVNDFGAWRPNRLAGDRVISDLPQVFGSWPVSGNGGQLFAACDPMYFQKHARGLIASVSENSPNTALHIHLFNPTDAILHTMAEFRKNLQSDLLTWTWEYVSTYDMDWHEKSIFLASLRFPRIYEATKSSMSPILAIDVDCFIRKDLEPYFDVARGYDIGLVLRPEFRDRAKRVLAVAVYVAPTIDGLAVFGAAASRMAAHLAYKRATEKLDQRCLWSSYASSRSRIRFWPIPSDLADFEFRDSSAIWTGKGHRKESTKYLDELDTIISKFERISKNIKRGGIDDDSQAAHVNPTSLK